MVQLRVKRKFFDVCTDALIPLRFGTFFQTNPTGIVIESPASIKRRHRRLNQPERKYFMIHVVCTNPSN